MLLLCFGFSGHCSFAKLRKGVLQFHFPSVRVGARSGMKQPQSKRRRIVDPCSNPGTTTVFTRRPKLLEYNLLAAPVVLVVVVVAVVVGDSMNGENGA